MKITRSRGTQFFFTIVLAVFLVTCSSNLSKKSGDFNLMKGFITIVGNEPFVKLALRTDDNQIFLLQLNDELKQKLWKEQGTYYYITYSDLRQHDGTTTITVVKVHPLNEETK